jgi:hypothetical protein
VHDRNVSTSQLTDMNVYRYPTHRQEYTLCAFVFLLEMHAIMFTSPLSPTRSTASQGISSSRPSNVHIESSGSERWAMAASGSVAWIAWRSKINVSCILSVCPLSPSVLCQPHDDKPTACVCFLTGINGESSFERALLQRAPGCEVWGYDYSVDGVRIPGPFFY